MSPAGGPDAGRLFEIFFDLVRIDSESGHEAGVADYITSFCAKLGFAVQQDSAGKETGGEVGNLVVRVPAGCFTPLAPVILCAHMDTVRPGVHVLPFDMGDRFVSMSETVLGADCKAGIAALLATVEWLSSSGGAYRSMELLFTVQEEPGLLGARHLDRSLIDGEWGVVLDGSGPVGGIVLEAPTQDRISLTVRGKAAHAGVEPEKGRNAICCAAKGITGIEVGRLDEVTTLNIGTISGGVANNIVPELAQVECEARSLSTSRLDDVRRGLIESFKRAAEDCGCELEVEVQRSFEHFKLDAGSLPAAFLARSLKESGFEPSFTSSGGGSDANVLNLKGIPCAVMNIGLVGAHTSDEYILKDEMEGLARTVTALARLSLDEQKAPAR